MDRSPNNYFLVGMMGAGKSAVGRQLARRLQWTFVDLDDEIRRRTGVSIATIFELEGEAGFRRREEQVFDDVTRQVGQVVATGGGAILSAATRARLAERGVTIYLEARVHDLWLRTRRDRSRPLLACDDPKARLAELLAAREPFYREVADLVVETGHAPVARVADDLVARLRRHAGDARVEADAAARPEAR